MDTARRPVISRPPKLYSHRTKFSTLLRSDINLFSQDLLNISDVQSLYSSFTSIITNCLRKASSFLESSSSIKNLKQNHFFPQKFVNNTKRSKTSSFNYSTNSDRSKNNSKVKNIKNPCPWWNSECDLLVSNHKRALEIFKNNKSRINFLAYKKEVAKARIGLRNIKKENFSKFCENLRKDSDPSYIWRKIKAFKNSFSQSETFNRYNKEVINSVRNQIISLFPSGMSLPSISLHNHIFKSSLDLPFTKLNWRLLFVPPN